MLEKQERDALFTIIEYGVLNARHYAFEGNDEQVVNELDHIHNLPSLLRDPDDEHMRYYLTVERNSYQQKTDGKCPMKFHELWKVFLRRSGVCPRNSS